MIDFEAQRFPCGHTSMAGPSSERFDDLAVGAYVARLTISQYNPTDTDAFNRTCWRCLMNKKSEAPEECRADRHDFQLSSDRVRDQIYGTGGWDMSFRCARENCAAAKYTTYGLKLLYLSNHDRSKIWDIDREES